MAQQKEEHLEDWETIDGAGFAEAAATDTPVPQGEVTLVRQSLEKVSKLQAPDIDCNAKVQPSKFKYKTVFSDPPVQFPAQALGSAAVSITPSEYPPTDNPQSYTEILKEIGYSGPPSKLPRSFLIAINNRFAPEDLAKFKEDAELNFSHALPYFFSGSFIFPSCLRSATDGTTLLSIAKSMTPATLLGHTRHAVKGQPYPAMLPSTNAEDKVRGMLVFSMLDAQRRAIHQFENGMFDLKRTEVEIELKDGKKVVVDAGVYVWNQSPNRLVAREDRAWKVEDLLGSSWFTGIIKKAEVEENFLEGDR
ncbi:hypothetical protein CC78DRAFT_528533 [Lojkania enalia]|uniref:Putative gamma-glutamylcyclotransferase n=1 Tax=Lojkania enalia TaxID=147567 RepID=A0A9P4NB68_9PLEO|nr:hypothetical protein CC78DRAFT_528533 [Didymosphaeria enalia]